MKAQKFKDTTDHVFIVNGHELGATIQYLYDYDQESIDVAFESEEENTAYVARFDSGELVSLNITIKATWRDVVGYDNLCACHVYSRTAEKELAELAEHHGMVDEALAQLKQHIEHNIAVYTTLSVKGPN